MARNRRDRWSRDVITAKRLPSSTRLFLSSVLSRHMRASGFVSRSRDALAAEMGCGIRTIDRHFTRALDVGWLVQIRPGYLGHTAEFEASWPDEMRGSMSDRSGAHMSDKNSRAYLHQSGAHMSDKNVAPSSTSGTTTAYGFKRDLKALPNGDADGTQRRDVLALEMDGNSKSKRSGRTTLRAVPA